MKQTSTSLSLLLTLCIGMSLTSCGSQLLSFASSSSSSTSSATSTSSMTSSSSTAAAADTQATINALLGTWKAVNVQGTAISSATGTDTPAITFAVTETDAPAMLNLYAYNGCNYINGIVEANGTRLTRHAEFISTMRACPDNGYESKFTEALTTMTTVKLQSSGGLNTLLLLNSSGKTVMTLRRHNLNVLNGAWQVTNLNGKDVAESVGMRLVFDLDNQTLHGNAGCNIVNGKITPDPNAAAALKLSELITTRMTCPNIQLEQEFLKALEEVATANIPDSDTTTIKLTDSSGNTLITLQRLSKEELLK